MTDRPPFDPRPVATMAAGLNRLFHGPDVEPCSSGCTHAIRGGYTALGAANMLARLIDSGHLTVETTALLANLRTHIDAPPAEPYTSIETALDGLDDEASRRVHNVHAHPLLVECPPLGEWLHDRTRP